jgi:hypothetical protein
MGPNLAVRLIVSRRKHPRKDSCLVKTSPEALCLDDQMSNRKSCTYKARAIFRVYADQNRAEDFSGPRLFTHDSSGNLISLTLEPRQRSQTPSLLTPFF